MKLNFFFFLFIVKNWLKIYFIDRNPYFENICTIGKSIMDSGSEINYTITEKELLAIRD